VRCAFEYAYDAELIDRPIRFGPGFQRPSRKVLRLHRAEAGPKLFTAEEVRRPIDVALVPVQATILLGINCGFGNSDCGNLPLSAIDWDNAVIDYPRPKTGIARRCPLWPEAVAALRAALAKRPEPEREEDAGLVFLTHCRVSWYTGTTVGPLSKQTSKLLKKLGINGRQGLGFYTLRHTFRTVADEAKDQPATTSVRHLCPVSPRSRSLMSRSP
jgi:integrase